MTAVWLGGDQSVADTGKSYDANVGKRP
jgi:hypothetical protein